MRDWPRHPRRLGLPYHGLVRNGELTLPNGRTITYGATFVDGSCHVVRNTAGANTRAFSAEEVAHDTAEGKEWLDYGLVASGNLGSAGICRMGYWLYCDPAGTVWIMRLRHQYFSAAPTSRTFEVIVVGRFGVLQTLPTPIDYSANRVAGSGVFTLTLHPDVAAHNPALTALDVIANLFAQPGTNALGTVSYNETGSVVAATYFGSRSLSDTDGENFLPVVIVSITVSGTGSLAKGQIGQGITATLAFEGMDQLVSSYKVDVWPPPWPGYEDFPNFSWATTASNPVDCNAAVTNTLVGAGGTNSYYHVWDDIEYIAYKYWDGTLVKRKTFVYELREFERNVSGAEVITPTNCIVTSYNNSIADTNRKHYKYVSRRELHVGSASAWMEMRSETEVIQIWNSGGPQPFFDPGQMVQYAPVQGSIPISYVGTTWSTGREDSWDWGHGDGVLRGYVATPAQDVWEFRMFGLREYWFQQYPFISMLLTRDGREIEALTGLVDRAPDPEDWKDGLRATLHPVTGQLEWSETDRLCWV